MCKQKRGRERRGRVEGTLRCEIWRKIEILKFFTGFVRKFKVICPI